MALFGYEIVNVLVTDIIPDAKVKSAMNNIHAAQREQVAAESKARQGQGIANQRKAIIRRAAGLDRTIPKSGRRRVGERGDAAGNGDEVFRHIEVHWRKRQDQHIVFVSLARRA